MSAFDAALPAETDTAPGRSAYTIGEPGRAWVEVRAGVPSHPPAWPDTAIDSASAPGVDIRAASVRGLAHRFLGTPRQDCYSLGWLADDAALVVTVCDGVGALELSHEAAHLVCRAAPHHVASSSAADGVDWATVFAGLSAHVSSSADRSGTDSEMATTAICARVTTVGDGRFQAELGWVGDSAAYRLSGCGWEVVGGAIKDHTDANDGVATAHTSALPSDRIVFGSATVPIDADEVLFLMSDGISDPLGSGAGDVGATLASWWHTPPAPLEFAAQVGFARKSFDDDRTAVGIWFTK